MTADRLNAKPQRLYVATDGRDEWSGTRPYPAQDDGPFRSLERARDEIRRLRRGSPDRRPCPEIHIRGGRYELPGTFTLTAADSGAPGHPVVYRARANERVTLTGGRHCRVRENAVPAEVGSRLAPAARDRVVALDTDDLGGDLGEMQYRGKDVEPARGALELFVAGRRIPMARWPNRGWERVARRCRRGKGFYYRGGPRTWQGTAGAWLHGFWRWDWADFYLPVESVCAKKRLITVSRAPEYGFRAGARYRVVNVLEELDQPGEWYLDRISNAVYLWPPEGAKEPVVSALETILRLDRTSHVVFAGIDFDASRGNAIEVNAGAAATFKSCSVRNSGGWGIAVNGGERHCVERCEVADTGTGGVLLAGGDRASLAGAGHRVANCDIRRFGAVVMSYSPGVRLEGVGNCATGNRISDGPHSAVILSGNEHRVEGNDIRDVCNQTADAGAVYLGRDWTMRGNAIRGNVFRCIRGLGGKRCQGSIPRRLRQRHGGSPQTISTG